MPYVSANEKAVSLNVHRYIKGQALADSPVMGADYAAAVAKLPDVRGVPGCDVDASGHFTTVGFCTLESS
jgi:hypothetical protein